VYTVAEPSMKYGLVSEVEMMGEWSRSRFS